MASTPSTLPHNGLAGGRGASFILVRSHAPTLTRALAFMFVTRRGYW